MRAYAIAGGVVVAVFVAYVMTWAAIDEFRWDRPDYAVPPILLVVLIGSQMPWLIRTRR